jgi:RNA polymerase sigma-70 factor, ECF subfamily
MSVLPIKVQIMGVPFGGFLPRRAHGTPMIGRLQRSERTMMPQPLSQLSDEALLEAHVHGDRSALKALIQRYRDELLHFLTRFLGSRAAAEDVFQETFLQVHLSAETFDASRRLKPWLYTIAANKARDHHRKYGRRATVSLSAPIRGEQGGQQYVDLMEAGLPAPDAPILDAERSRLIKTVVDELPAHLREILLLSYFQRMSYGQIADALEIPLGTVKSRLHTAVGAFARAWAAARAESCAEDDSAQDGRTR